MALASDRPVTLAVIIGAHGVTGEVRLKIFAESLDGLKAQKSYNDGSLTLKSLRPHKGGAIARFAEVADRNAAEALRGTELSIARSSLPPLGDGEYYHVDLIGLPVLSDGGDVLGEVIAVQNYGAGDVVEIRRPNGKAFMVPMNEEAVPEWSEAQLVVAAAYAE